MLPSPPQLEPDIEPDQFLQTLVGGWTLWIILILAVLLIVAGFLWYRHQQKATASDAPSREEICIRKIDALLAQSPDLKVTATQLSLILRSYLSDSSNDPALFETHQEFSRRANALLTLPATVQLPIRELLERLAQLKYEQDSPENMGLARDLASRSKDLVTEIARLNQVATEETHQEKF